MNIMNITIKYNNSQTMTNLTEYGTFTALANNKSPLWLIVKYSNTYLIPFIVMSGFVGNVCSFMVFVFSKLNRISTSIYLAALAISDTGFLVCVWVGWFDIIGIHFFHQEGVCHMVVFMTYVFGFTSVWYVNAFTADMYVAVFHSSLGTKICRPGFAKKSVIGLVIFAVVFYLFSFWTSKVIVMSNGEKKCVSAPQNYEQMMIFTVLDTLLTLIIPFSMIIFMITRLLVDISKFYTSSSQPDETRNNCQTESLNSLTAIDPTNGTNPSTQQGMKAQSKLTRMIVVVILVFLVLNLPCHVIRLQSILRSAFDHTYITSRNEILWQMFFQIIYYVNFSVNFVLYSACAKSFRSALMRFPWRACCIKCHSCCIRFNKMATYKINSHRIRSSEEKYNEKIGETVHSRLVDIHLSELHISQIPSFESDFVLKSPPCMLMGVASTTEQTRL